VSNGRWFVNVITNRLSNDKDTRHALLLLKAKRKKIHSTCNSTAGAIECVDAVKKRLKNNRPILVV